MCLYRKPWSVVDKHLQDFCEKTASITRLWDWSLKHATTPQTAQNLGDLSFHSVNFGDQFPSPSLDFCWKSLSTGSPLHLSFLSFHRFSLQFLWINATQLKAGGVFRGFRSQTIWNTCGNENLGAVHPKSVDPERRNTSRSRLRIIRNSRYYVGVINTLLKGETYVQQFWDTPATSIYLWIVSASRQSWSKNMSTPK